MIRKACYICVFVLFSCGGGNEETLPPDVLEKEQLIPLIVDLQILESHFQRQFTRIDLYKDALDSSSVSIFDAHGISKSRFETSIQYYAENPDTLFTIYEAALDTINFRLNAVN